MATQFKHSYKEFGVDAVHRRIQQMLAFRDNVDVANAHVKFSLGNRKTGNLVPSVSLIPVADCGNCAFCSRGCYDVRNVCYQTTVQKARANNSAIARDDMDRFFLEVYGFVVERKCKFFRYHIGGDILDLGYLEHMVDIAGRVPDCQFLAFTKMYGLVNRYIEVFGTIPDNLHIIFSDWRNARFDNPYNFPVSSPLWEDGTTGPHCTDSRFLCPGNCSECGRLHIGCWAAGAGDTILFEAH